jgi:hypothetical protein
MLILLSGVLLNAGKMEWKYLASLFLIFILTSNILLMTVLLSPGGIPVYPLSALETLDMSRLPLWHVLFLLDLLLKLFTLSIPTKIPGINPTTRSMMALCQMTPFTSFLKRNTTIYATTLAFMPFPPCVSLQLSILMVFQCEPKAELPFLVIWTVVMGENWIVFLPLSPFP